MKTPKTPNSDNTSIKFCVRISSEFYSWLKNKTVKEGFKNVNDLARSILSNEPFVVPLEDNSMEDDFKILSQHINEMNAVGIVFNNQMKLFMRYNSLAHNMKKQTETTFDGMYRIVNRFIEEITPVVQKVKRIPLAEHETSGIINYRGKLHEDLTEQFTLYITPEIFNSTVNHNADFKITTSLAPIIREKLANDTRKRVFKSSNAIKLNNIVESMTRQTNLILKNYYMLLDQESFSEYKEEVTKTISPKINELVDRFKALKSNLVSL